MDWNNVVSTITIIALFVVMMRGCGAMAGGGCGMGRSRGRVPKTSPEVPHDASGTSSH